MITDWVGYFEGVKGRYVFFAADDGYNGAIAYAVFDSQTRDKLFVLNVEMSTNDQPDKNNIHSLQLSDEALTILYRRAYSGDCSLYDGTSECWQRLQKELTLPADASSPDCRKSYEAAQKRTQAYAAEILKAPTVIGYEARLTYQAGQTVISKETGTISCWISD